MRLSEYISLQIDQRMMYEDLITCSPDEVSDKVIDILRDGDAIFESESDFVSYLKEACDKAEDSGLKLKDCVDEGILGGILGTVGGIAFGPKVGNAICSALGITKGPLYTLLNSRLVTTAICAKLGLNA